MPCEHKGLIYNSKSQALRRLRKKGKRAPQYDVEYNKCCDRYELKKKGSRDDNTSNSILCST